MTVGELEELLARLPEDMPVLIQGLHIERVYKENRGTRPRVTGQHTCSAGRCVVLDYEDVEHPAYLNLWTGPIGRGRSITKEAPPVEVRGNWPKARRRADQLATGSTEGRDR